MKVGAGRVEVFAYAGARCPECLRPLRPVGGGTFFIGTLGVMARSHYDYVCELGHKFTSTVDRLCSGASITSELHRVDERQEPHVHFA